MNIAIIGGTGLVGNALSQKIKATIVSRSGPVTLEDFLKKDMFCRYDVIINLAGRSIDALRWTQSIKKEIIDSRCNIIKKVSKAATTHKHAPWLIQASGQSYYGLFEKSIHVFTEQDAPEPSDTFMQDVAFAIEKTCKAYPGHTSLVRIAPVLSPSKGVFPQLILSSKFRMHLVPGSGTQMFSWIALDDLVTGFETILKFKLLGAVNMASPKAISFGDMYQSIETHLPGLKVHMPSLSFKLLLGEKSQLILKGNEIYPQKLIQHNMCFKYKDFATFCEYAIS